MAFPFSTRQSWVVKSVATGATDTSTLKPFQIGIFDAESCSAVKNFTQSPYIFMAAGSPNYGAQVTQHPRVPALIDKNQRVSFKTDKFYGKNLLPARVAKPGKKSYPQTVYIGYDGINSCKSLNFQCGKTYMVNVLLYGAAINAIYNKGLEYGVSVTVPACDDCATDCISPNVCSTVIDQLVNELNMSWTAPYVKAEKVISCCNTTALTPTYCREWNITLCDEGNALTLAELQVQYPTVDIKIASKLGSQTTYSFIQDDAATPPAAYSQSNVVIVGCETCPSGYTTVNSSKILAVTIDNAGLATTDAAALTEVQTVIPAATKAVKTGFQYGTSSYIVSVPLSYVIPAAPIADTTIVDTGDVTEKQCVLTTPVTTAWVQGKRTYRIQRKLEITVDNPDCAGSDLADIQKSLSGVKTIVPGSIVVKTAGTCKSIYELEQYSQCMEDGCDTLAIAAFENLPRYKGHVWEVPPCAGWTVSGTGCPIPPAATTPADCRCGVKFTGGFIDYSNKSCVFDPTDAVNYDQIQFSVSVSEVSPVGVANMLKAVNVDYTQNVETGRKFLSGQEVIREIIEYRNYRGNEIFFAPTTTPMGYKFTEAEGIQYGVNTNSFYYAVYIPYLKHGDIHTAHMHMANKTELALYFEEKDYGTMIQFMNEYNKYLTSAGINLPVITL